MATRILCPSVRLLTQRISCETFPDVCPMEALSLRYNVVSTLHPSFSASEACFSWARWESINFGGKPLVFARYQSTATCRVARLTSCWASLYRVVPARDEPPATYVGSLGQHVAAPSTHFCVHARGVAIDLCEVAWSTRCYAGHLLVSGAMIRL